MLRNFHEDLKSIWLFVDVSEGFIVIFERFVLLLGEFLHPSVPLLLDVVESSINVPFDLSLFAGKMFLFFPFPLFLVIFPLEEEDVVGDVRGDTGFLVLNPF